jgi:hypothetical protein
MNKKVFITIIVFIIIAVAVFFFIKGSSAPTGNTGGVTGTLPPLSTTTAIATATPVVTPPATAPTGDTLVLGTPYGSVTMNNFYKTAEISLDQKTAVIQQTPAYIIDYNVADSSFTIGILSMPFDVSRQAAETELLKSLGISRQEACKLKVYEGVPASVPGSEQYVGQTFSLSFCASSTFGQ